jgi:hypothetical protein
VVLTNQMNMYTPDFILFEHKTHQIININFYEFYKNKYDIIDAIQEDRLIFEGFPQEIRDDIDVILTALKFDGNLLQMISEHLRGNKIIIKTAITNNAFSIQYAPDEMRNDKEIALIALKKSGHIFKFLSLELRDDKEIALIAVTKCPLSLIYASDRLKKDKDVVMTAINGNLNALEFASIEMFNNKEVMLFVLRYGFIVKKNQDDNIIPYDIVNVGMQVFFKISEKLQCDIDVYLLAHRMPDLTLEKGRKFDNVLFVFSRK